MGNFYSDGGFFMNPVLLTGLAGLGLAVAEIINRKKPSSLTPLIVGVAVWMLMLGTLGTAIGLINTFEAIASADPEIKTLMAMAGAAISLNPIILALGFLIAQTMLAGLAFTLRANALPASSPGAPETSTLSSMS